MKKGKYFLILLSLFLIIYYFSYRITPAMKNVAEKEINQFVQIVINHTSFSQQINHQKLYTINKNNNQIQSLSFNMNYINQIASDYINNLEETLFQIEEGLYKNKDKSIYNRKLLKISQNKGIIASIPLGALTHNIFLENIGPSIHVKYKTLSLSSSSIHKDVKNYGINHIAISIDIDVTLALQIIIPLSKEQFKEKYNIPLIYEIIEGEVPSWYQAS